MGRRAQRRPAGAGRIQLGRLPPLPGGDRGGVTLRFPVYEQLPVDAESPKLLDLQDQHPDAQVVGGADSYTAAEARFYPHG